MSSKTYSLNNTRQLIDLNGDAKNFTLSFSVTSRDGGEFDALVVDQTTLDSSSEIVYKKTVGGVIAGDIRSDKDVYQNYFLILKSEEKRDVDVTIDIQEIQPAPEPAPEPEPTQNFLQPSDENINEFTPVVTPKTSSINWKLILIVIIVIGGGFLLYKFYMSKKDKVVDNGSRFNPVKPLTSSTLPVAPAPTPAPTPTPASVPVVHPSAIPSPVPAIPSPVPDVPSPANPSPASIRPTRQSSPTIVPTSSKESIRSFGFGDVNRGLLDRMNNIKLK